MEYPKLSSPLTIKKTTFKNRVVFPPVQTNYAAPNGETTKRHINFYENIAQNNVGLTIVGATGISPYSRLGDHAFCLYEEQHVETGKALFEAIGNGGSVPAVQINHGGRVMNPKLAGEKLIGPSAISSPTTNRIPHELTVEEIEEIINQFVRTAENAKKAGALMVELHGAHSFLLNQFMSPAANKRTDHYGGSTENRARIVREILKRVRQEVGEDFILGLRMSVDEFVDGGLTVEESSELIKMFVDDSLDIIHVSGGGADSGPKMVQAAVKGELIKLAGEIKKGVNIPVIAVGGVLKLEQVENALQEELADMVAIGRGLIADPELVTKTLEGRPEEIIECTGCMQCFMPGEDPGMTCPENENI
jgi:2,4-dienoyl-CoA reductase-like NADH-dependent reductase (Old Yellow Enzyme family)